MNPSIKFFMPLIIVTISSISCAGDKHVDTHTGHEPETENQQTRIHLSPETTKLLIKEMRELQEGMKKIVPALVAGEWEKIASIGKQMENSYIMKESMTKAQMHELHESLPEDFQKMDHLFHHSAGLLAKSAEEQDYEKVSHYYYKMTEACVECHTLYATHTFPEFLKPKKQ
jgi:hypothetical protein